MKILIPLSGGLDSATVLALAIRDNHEVNAVGFEYGQPHRIELEHAERIAARYGVPFETVRIPNMPKTNAVVFAGRNLVLAATAISLAAARGFGAVAFGCNASDWQDFPDCRPAFWNSVRAAAEAYGIRVLTPLIYHSKQDVAETARRYGVPIDLTWSCYSPRYVPGGDGWDAGGSRAAAYENHPIEPVPCGKCLACETRAKALAQ